MNAQLQPSYDENRILLDEPIDVYYQRRLDEANSTGLKLIDMRSPAHFHYYTMHPEEDEDTKTKAFGRAYHCAILEPDQFHKRYIVLPEDAPERPTEKMLNAKKPTENSIHRQDWWREWGHLSAGRVTLSAKDYDRAQRMGDAVRAHPLACGLIVGGDREVTFRWIDPRTGMKCKSRIDLNVPGEFMLDVKSCEDASREAFARAVTNYRYDLQMAHYVAGATECGQPVRRYVILACESQAPFVCQPYILDAMAEQRGWAIRERAIAKQAACVASGRWPGYSDTVEELTLPAWAFYGTEL